MPPAFRRDTSPCRSRWSGLWCLCRVFLDCVRACVCLCVWVCVRAFVVYAFVCPQSASAAIPDKCLRCAAFNEVSYRRCRGPRPRPLRVGGMSRALSSGLAFFQCACFHGGHCLAASLCGLQRSSIVRRLHRLSCMWKSLGEVEDGCLARHFLFGSLFLVRAGHFRAASWPFRRHFFIAI